MKFSSTGVLLCSESSHDFSPSVPDDPSLLWNAVLHSQTHQVCTQHCCPAIQAHYRPDEHRTRIWWKEKVDRAVPGLPLHHSALDRFRLLQTWPVSELGSMTFLMYKCTWCSWMPDLRPLWDRRRPIQQDTFQNERAPSNSHHKPLQKGQGF